MSSARSSNFLVDIVRRRAVEACDQNAYQFLGSDLRVVESLTYGELWDRVASIGSGLIARPVPDGRALLVYEPGLNFVCSFLGCIYAGVTAVPVYPPRNDRSAGRIRLIAEDCGASVALTSVAVRPQLERWINAGSVSASISLRATDGVSESNELIDPRESAQDATAFLQYTSGSTGTPKGVMITHRNIDCNERSIQQAFHHDATDIVLGWLPVYHDMGLIGNVLQPLYTGASCVLMAPATFLQRPMRWLQAISNFRATTSGGPNFAYELCARNATDADINGIDLSSWKVAFCGADTVRPSTLERFIERFAPCGFHRQAIFPCYGLAEGTLIVSGSPHFSGVTSTSVSRTALEQGRVATPCADSDVSMVASSGRAVADVEIAIVDPNYLVRSQTQTIGEIWVNGTGVASGYLGKPEETFRTFHAEIDGEPGVPYLRTGDLGFMLHGELYVTGRLKDLIIVAGRNFYPEDLETAAESSHPAFQPNGAAAFAVESDSGVEVVLVQELTRRHKNVDLAQAVLCLRRSVAESCGLSLTTVILTRIGSVLKTSSGKVRRSKCRDHYIASQFHPLYISKAQNLEPELSLLSPDRSVDISHCDHLSSPAGDIEQRLIALMARTFNVAPHHFQADQSVEAFGLDSLLTVELQHRIELEFGVNLPLSVCLGDTTISGLVSSLRSAARSVDAPPHLPDEDCHWHPLTVGQQALWMFQLLRPKGTGYNISGAARILNPGVARRMPAAIEALVARHDALRTRFRQSAGMVMQSFRGLNETSCETIDAAMWSDERLSHELQAASDQTFDFRNGSLFRTKLFLQGDGTCILHVSLHHIIADYWSMSVIMRELALLLVPQNPSTPLPPAVRYSDYVCSRQTDAFKLACESQWRYWSAHLAGTLPVLELPSSYRRPPVPTYRGGTRSCALTARDTCNLQDHATGCGGTLFSLLLTAYFVFLARTTGQSDLVVGVPVSGRTSANHAECVGYFVNTLPIRVQVSPSSSVRETFGQVQEALRNALAHQDLPFPEMVRRLRPVHDAGRNPIFQTMLVYFGQSLHGVKDFPALALSETARMDIHGLEIEPMSIAQNSAQCDVAVMTGIVDGCLTLCFRYSTDLYSASAIEDLLEIYRQTTLEVVQEKSKLARIQNESNTVCI